VPSYTLVLTPQVWIVYRVLDQVIEVVNTVRPPAQAPSID
jgi:hypothetical protein